MNYKLDNIWPKMKNTDFGYSFDFKMNAIQRWATELQYLHINANALRIGQRVSGCARALVCVAYIYEIFTR